MKGKFKVVQVGTGEKILEPEEIAMESSGLSFRVYCPQRMEMKVMSLSPNDTVARCLADIERAFDKVTTNSSSYGQHYSFNNTPGARRGLFCPKAQLLRIFTDAYSNSPVSPVLSPLLPTQSDGHTTTSAPVAGGWSENRPRSELKPSQQWLQSSGNRWKPVQTERGGGVEMGRRRTANEADLSVPTPSPGSNGEASQDDEDGASEATDSSTDQRENASDDDVDDIDDDDDVEEEDHAGRDGKPHRPLQWSRSGLSVSTPTLPQGPEDWDEDEEEQAAAKRDGSGSEGPVAGGEGGEEEEVLGRRNRASAQLRRVNSVGLIKKGNDAQHSSGEARTVRTKHSNSPVQSMSIVGELQERMQKLKAEAKEVGKEEGVWLENNRMLIDYNFKHGTLLLLRLLPTESNQMKGSASTMQLRSMSVDSGSTEEPPLLERRDSSSPAPALSARDLCSKAANELLTTERTYLSSLSTLIKVYVGPLQEQPFWTNSNAKKENSKSLFTILESIHAFHQHLLDQLEALMATYTFETQLGHVLVQMMPFLKLYSEYCSRYDKCTAELKNIFSTVIATRWLENCLTNDACHNLNIYAFLIMPVQRIPRYKMLIDLLIKHTPPDHGDYENLLQAQKKIVDVAQWVDSYKSNNDMMAELSGKIVGMSVPLMQAGRKFIFQGQLSKKPSSGKSGATTVRWFFLFSDVLIYAQEKRKAFVYKGSVNLFPAKFNLCVEDLPLKKLSFQIVGKRKVLLVLIARTQQDKDNWIRELNNVLNTEDSPKSGGSMIRLKRG